MRLGMAAVPAFAYFSTPSSPARSEKPVVDPDHLQRSLETLFPDMLLHGTRSCLLSMTTSLTRVSGQAYDYFSRLSQMLAFERMMRGFIRLATAPFPPEFSNFWTAALLQAAPQPASPWAFPAQQAKPAPAFGFFAPFQTHPAPRQMPALPFLPVGFQPQPPAQRNPSPWPDYGMMMIVPMAMLAAAPGIEAMWGLASSTA
jgi:hypothetical protein